MASRKRCQLGGNCCKFFGMLILNISVKAAFLMADCKQIVKLEKVSNVIVLKP